MLIVDDSSPDGTGEIAERLAERHENVSVLHRPLKEGLGPAYIAGFRRALAGGAGLVLEMDSDFSHDPAYLPRLLEAAERADLVLGSRYVAGGGVSDWGPLRKAISRGGSAYARLRARGRGARPDRRLQVLPPRGPGGDRPRLGPGPRLRLPGGDDLPGDPRGFRVVEVPIVFRDRRAGASKMDRSIVAEAIWRVPLLRFGRQYQPERPRKDDPGVATLYFLKY